MVGLNGLLIHPDPYEVGGFPATTPRLCGCSGLEATHNCVQNSTRKNHDRVHKHVHRNFLQAGMDVRLRERGKTGRGRGNTKGGGVAVGEEKYIIYALGWMFRFQRTTIK